MEFIQYFRVEMKLKTNKRSLPCLLSWMFFWRRRIFRRSSKSSVWFIWKTKSGKIFKLPFLKCIYFMQARLW